MTPAKPLPVEMSAVVEGSHLREDLLLLQISITPPVEMRATPDEPEPDIGWVTPDGTVARLKAPPGMFSGARPITRGFTPPATIHFYGTDDELHELAKRFYPGREIILTVREDE